MGWKSSIKFKLMAFALAAALVPAATMGWLFYDNNRALLEDRLSQRLATAAQQLSDSLDSWLRSRGDEVRSVAASDIVRGNLAAARAGVASAQAELGQYLDAVKLRLADLRYLVLTDSNGYPLAAGAGAQALRLDRRWFEDESATGPVVHYREASRSGEPAGLVLVVPLRFELDEVVGWMAAALVTDRIAERLEAAVHAAGESALLVAEDGTILMRSTAAPQPLGDRVSPSALADFSDERIDRLWTEDGQVTVAHPETLLIRPWQVIFQQSEGEAYAEIRRLSTKTLWISLLIALVTVAIAYLFADRIAAPVNRLIEGAKRVADGHLDVDLEVQGQDETAYLTRVFNSMVRRLRSSREALDAYNAELQARNRQLRSLSIHDPLTGLYNRQHFNQWIDRLLTHCRRMRKPLALLMLDVDHFKQLNDRYGHLAGDKTLRVVAQRIRGQLGFRDYAARYGGEEFIILMPGCDAGEAAATAERLVKAIREPSVRLGSEEVTLTASVGSAIFSRAYMDADTLLRQADQALYRAKDAGRDQHVAFEKATLRSIR